MIIIIVIILSSISFVALNCLSISAHGLPLLFIPHPTGRKEKGERAAVQGFAAGSNRGTDTAGSSSIYLPCSSVCRTRLSQRRMPTNI